METMLQDGDIRVVRPGPKRDLSSETDREALLVETATADASDSIEK